jgi:hypothetical protein
VRTDKILKEEISMSDSEEDIKRLQTEGRQRERRIDLLYKNLEYISSAYSLAEGAFPFWEAAFALIIGQVLMAYFTPGVCIYQLIWLAVSRLHDFLYLVSFSEPESTTCISS